jgi:TatD DNase family protein
MLTASLNEKQLQIRIPIYIQEFDQDRDEMMQLFRMVSLGFIPAIDSTYTEAMYDLETNYQ